MTSDLNLQAHKLTYTNHRCNLPVIAGIYEGGWYEYRT